MASNSDCSLREAISAASSGATIIFKSNLGGVIELHKRGFDIRKDLTLQGPGSSSLTIDAGYRSDIFTVYSNFKFSVSGITFFKGQSAIKNDGAEVRITNCVFKNNSSSSGAAIRNFSGAIIVDSCTFQGNKDNAVANSGYLSLSNSTFLQNAGDLVNLRNATMQVVNTTIDAFGNISVRNLGQLTIINSTLQGNGESSAYTIFNYKDEPTAKAIVQNTIIANHSSHTNCFGPITDGHNNLQFPNADCGSTITVADPKLAPLADNGGPTQTMALLPGSAAIGKGDVSICTSQFVNNHDQRGFVRAANPKATTACDVGAFQHDGSASIATPAASSTATH